MSYIDGLEDAKKLIEQSYELRKDFPAISPKVLKFLIDSIDKLQEQEFVKMEEQFRDE